MPVNQTVKPLVAMVPRFMDANLLRKSRGTIPTRTYSGKEYAEGVYRLSSQSGTVSNFSYIGLVKIARCVIPGIDPGAIHAAFADGNDQIMHTRPERAVASSQSHVSVLIREISADIGMGVDDGPEVATRLLGPLQCVQEGLRIHHVAV